MFHSYPLIAMIGILSNQATSSTHSLYTHIYITYIHIYNKLSLYLRLISHPSPYTCCLSINFYIKQHGGPHRTNITKKNKKFFKNFSKIKKTFILNGLGLFFWRSTGTWWRSRTWTCGWTWLDWSWSSSGFASWKKHTCLVFIAIYSWKVSSHIYVMYNIYNTHVWLVTFQLSYYYHMDILTLAC